MPKFNTTKTQQLSQHFSLREMTKTSQKDFLAENIILANQYIFELSALCNYALEPARAVIGRPLIITSAYRSPKLNAALGGAENSQHLKGQAADFIVKDLSAKEVWQKLKSSPFLRYGQLLYEGGWVHISLGAPWRPLAKCQQAFEVL
ncbi:MAG: DUF882 domain-containing protein [Elusimicrobiota bacterium]|nr:DUF882 domain-containing protein [Elusimicrobiota bacterium]